MHIPRGTRFGRLRVIARAPSSSAKANCRCDCGLRQKFVEAGARKTVRMLGKRFGRLLVTERRQ
jgi:hypothetical protein